MRWLLTLPVAIWRRLLLIVQGVLALLVLIGTGIGACSAAAERWPTA